MREREEQRPFPKTKRHQVFFLSLSFAQEINAHYIPHPHSWHWLINSHSSCKIWFSLFPHAVYYLYLCINHNLLQLCTCLSLTMNSRLPEGIVCVLSMFIASTSSIMHSKWMFEKWLNNKEMKELWELEGTLWYHWFKFLEIFSIPGLHLSFPFLFIKFYRQSYHL